MRSLATLVLFAVLAPASYSQSILHTFDSDSEFDYFGISVSGAGDVNGDGFADVIVGAILDYDKVTYSGSARVYSGLDGSVLHKFDGDSKEGRFGNSVSGAGDVNGDGFADLIVGAWRDEFLGSARVISGLDGTVLYTFYGDPGFEYFGYSVSGAGDLNGDGFDEVIVGAFRDSNTATASGSARVFSGLDGSILYTFNGDSEKDYFGISVSGAGDVNGDGTADLIVGAMWDDNNGSDSGSASVFSGVDGSVLYAFNGDSPNDNFGFSVSAAGDVNADGYADLVVGARLDDNNGSDSGSARVFSGVDGSVLYSFDGDSPDDNFGFSVSGAGDVNKDGYADVIVGAPRIWTATDHGYVRVFSGVDGSVLYTLYGDSPENWFGCSVAGAGDTDGDGYADLIVGAFGEESNGLLSGSARVFSGCDACGTSLGQNYCGPANFNSTGQSAVISAFGRTQATKNFVTLTARQLPLNVWGYFLNSDVQDFKPFTSGSQGNLCLGGGIGRHAKQVANTGGAGELIIDLDLSALPRPGATHSVVAGETWNFQCWFRDANPGPTSNFSDGVAILFE